MAIKFKFPIRYKILAVLSAVVVLAVAFYLYLASKIFHEDKTLLVYELNQSNVRAVASDIEGNLLNIINRLKLASEMLGRGTDKEMVSSLFSSDRNFLRVAKVQNDSNVSEIFQRADALAEYKLGSPVDSSYFAKIRARYPIPLASLQTSGIWVRNVAAAGESIPLFTAAIPTPDGGALFADLRLETVLSPFQEDGIASVYVTDSEGHLLAHTDQAKLLADSDLRNDPLVAAGATSKARSEVKRYEDSGAAFLGAWQKTKIPGVTVVSRVEEGKAFDAARRLVRKSAIYALLVVTVAFLVALFFAHSLTSPIQTLMAATARVARGDFSSLVHVKSHDELATLANSFNSMTMDLKSSRAQIEEHSRDLEKKVAERTVEIREAQEALVKTTRLASVGEVAGRAAHEVLNPLTSVIAKLERMKGAGVITNQEDIALLDQIVKAWSDDSTQKGPVDFLQELLVPSQTLPGKTLLQEDLENLQAIARDSKARHEQMRSDVEFLLKEAQRIGRIVDGMRKLTRVSGNRKPVDVGALLEELFGSMSDVLARRKIETSLSIPPEDSLMALADKDELLQVFGNLLRNSAQAIEEAQLAQDPNRIVGQPPRVQVAATREGELVAVRVEDNGPGISAENFEKVFDASFTTKDADVGTGLGLSIARRFVRAFEGDIVVESSIPGEKTVFLVTLPTQRTDEEA